MGYILALCLALCWGTAPLATKNIVSALPPVWGTFYRVLAGLVFFAVLYAVQRKSLKIPLSRLWKPALLGFTLILFPFAALSWGQQFVAPTVGGIFYGTVPIWSFIAAGIFLGGEDRFTLRRTTGVIFGLIGMWTIMWPMVSAGAQSLDNSPKAIFGCAAFILMTWSLGMGGVLIKKIMVDECAITPQANTFYQYLISAVILLAAACVCETAPAPAAFSTKVTVSILAAGVLSSAVAFLLMVALVRRWGATRMAAVAYLSPVVAMAGDFITAGRIPSGPEAGGLLLIFVSLFLIQKKVSAKN